MVNCFSTKAPTSEIQWENKSIYNKWHGKTRRAISTWVMTHSSHHTQKMNSTEVVHTNVKDKIINIFDGNKEYLWNLETGKPWFLRCTIKTNIHLKMINGTSYNHKFCSSEDTNNQMKRLSMDWKKI